jgi:plasmid stabilization system protein ParE
MSFGIHVTAMAVADMADIYAHLAETSPEAAERVQTSIEDVIASLTDLPKRYALAPEAFTHRKEVRHVVVGKYRVVFMVIMETVNILRIRHVAQAPLGPDELN